MGPGGIAQLLRDYGATGVSALCISAMVAMFVRLGSIHAQLIVELKSAQERETAALKSVLPVIEKLLMTVSVLEAKQRRRASGEITNPGTQNPLLAVPK